MSTIYTTQLSKKLLGGHVCSKCKSVVLTEFSLQSTGVSSISRNQAQEYAQLAANICLHALQNFHQKPFLVTQCYDSRKLAGSHSFELDHLENGCPFCGNIERWQRGSYFADACAKDPKTGIAIVSDVPAESRLVVFSSAEMLSAWADRKLGEYTLQFSRQWAENPDKLQEIKGQIENCQKSLSEMESMQTLVKAKSEKLSEQVKRKEAECMSYPLFSGDRKRAKAELKELKKQYEAQRAVDLDQEKKLNGRIKDMQTRIKDLQIENPGMQGKWESISANSEFLRQALHFD